jgi:hypothetical protein
MLAARAGLVPGLPLMHPAFYIRPARVEEAAALSESIIADGHRRLGRGRLSLLPAHVAASIGVPPPAPLSSPKKMFATFARSWARAIPVAQPCAALNVFALTKGLGLKLENGARCVPGVLVRWLQ